MKKILLFYLFTFLPLQMQAQVGDHRSDLAIGVNGGYALTHIGFMSAKNISIRFVPCRPR